MRRNALGPHSSHVVAKRSMLSVGLPITPRLSSFPAVFKALHYNTGRGRVPIDVGHALIFSPQDRSPSFLSVTVGTSARPESRQNLSWNRWVAGRFLHPRTLFRIGGDGPPDTVFFPGRMSSEAGDVGSLIQGRHGSRPASLERGGCGSLEKNVECSL